MKNNKYTLNSEIEFSGNKYKIVKCENESDYCAGCECEDCQEAQNTVKGCFIWPNNIIFKKIN